MSKFLVHVSFQIVHVEGKKNVVADTLSRKPQVSAMSISYHNELEEMKGQYAEDEAFARIYDQIINGQRHEHYTVKSDFLMMHAKLCVTKQLRPKVLIECHAPPYAGHRGIDATPKECQDHWDQCTTNCRGELSEEAFGTWGFCSDQFWGCYAAKILPDRCYAVGYSQKNARIIGISAQLTAGDLEGNCQRKPLVLGDFVRINFGAVMLPKFSQTGVMLLDTGQRFAASLGQSDDPKCKNSVVYEKSLRVDKWLSRKLNWVLVSLMYRFFKAKSPEERALVDLDTHYTKDYLDEMAGEFSRRQLLYKEYAKNISASGLQNTHGQKGQMNACWTHQVSSEDYERLRTSSILISVVHGRSDVIAQIQHARAIARKLYPAARLLELPGGHLITHQHTKEVNQELLELIQATCTNLPNTEWQKDLVIHEDEENDDKDDRDSCACIRGLYRWLTCKGGSLSWEKICGYLTAKQQ
ncbi:hypothetical protein L7F22_032150 [Adiantum nelumboides]|nr:hypothetical protein [Adiantum nelumboides]